MHEAAENGYVEIIRLLLSYGADPMLATYAGQTPLSLATDEASIDLLRKHLEDVRAGEDDSSDNDKKSKKKKKLKGVKKVLPWIFGGPARFFGKFLISGVFNLKHS